MLGTKRGIQIGSITRGIIIAFATAVALCAPALAFADEPEGLLDSDANPSAASVQTDGITVADNAGVAEEDADVDAGDGIGDSASENDADVEPTDPNDTGDNTGSEPDTPGSADGGDAEGDFPQNDETTVPSDEGENQNANGFAGAVADAERSFDDASAIGEIAVKSSECDISSNSAEAIEAPAPVATSSETLEADDSSIAETPQQTNDEIALPEPDATEALDPEMEAVEPSASVDAPIAYVDDVVQPVAAIPVIQTDESTAGMDCESTDSESEPPIQPDLPMPLEPNGPIVPPTSVSSQMRSMDNAEQPDSLSATGEIGSSDFRLSATKAFTGKAPRSTAPCLGQHRCRSPNISSS